MPGAAPDFLVIGHLVQDLLVSPRPRTGEGPGVRARWRLGGAAAYASLLAHNFGLRTAVLTSCADDLLLASLLPDIETRVIPAAATTQMRNVYSGADSRRRQRVPQRAAGLTPTDLPDEWRAARIVLLSPIAGEVDPALAAAFSPETLIGAGAQGWLRKIGADGVVRPIPYDRWDATPLLRHVHVRFLSDEDLRAEDAPAALAEWGALVNVLAFTRGVGGADVFSGALGAASSPSPLSRPTSPAPATSSQPPSSSATPTQTTPGRPPAGAQPPPRSSSKAPASKPYRHARRLRPDWATPPNPIRRSRTQTPRRSPCARKRAFQAATPAGRPCSSRVWRLRPRQSG